MITVNVKGLYKAFGEKTLYEDYSKKFQGGTTTVIMGNSGCGKTTLLNIIMGLESVDEGEISFVTDDGDEILNKDVRFSAIFQEDRLIEGKSALSNVYMVAKGQRQAVKQRAIEILTALGMGDSLSVKAKELSGGMRRRVAIARALIADYDVLIADEPFTGLDDLTKKEVLQYFKNATKGKTVIAVTHDEKEKESLSL